MSTEQVNNSTRAQDDANPQTSAPSGGLFTSLQLDELLRQHSESAGNWVDVVDEEIHQSETYRELIQSEEPETPTSTVPRSQTEPALSEVQKPQERILSPPYVAYVSGLDYSCHEPDVYYLFGGYQRVLDLVFHFDTRDAKRFMGDALIEFRTQADLEHALKMDKTIFFKRMIHVFRPYIPPPPSAMTQSSYQYHEGYGGLRTQRYDSRGSVDSNRGYIERSSSRASAQGQENYSYQQPHGQKFQKFGQPRRESQDVRMASNYDKLQSHVYSTRSRNDSMTSNQSTLDRRQMRTPRSTMSQAGSELSLADSVFTEPHLPSRPKMDPYGGAKPVDIKPIQVEYEEKMKHEREELAKKREEEERQRKKSTSSEKDFHRGGGRYHDRHHEKGYSSTDMVPGQMKILHRDRWVSQEDAGGSLSSRRETAESQVIEEEKEEEIAQEDAKKDPTQPPTGSQSDRPPANRQFSGSKRHEKSSKTTYTFYNTTRGGGHGRGGHRGAPFKRSTESLGQPRGERDDRREKGDRGDRGDRSDRGDRPHRDHHERHHKDRKFNKTSSTEGQKEGLVGAVAIAGGQEGEDVQVERRHSVMSDTGTGKPPKPESGRKDSFHGQARYQRFEHQGSKDGGYKGHGGRDGGKSRHHKFSDDNSTRSSSDPTHAKRFPRRSSGKSSRKGSMDEAPTHAHEPSDISHAPTSTENQENLQKDGQKPFEDRRKPVKSASVEVDDKKRGSSRENDGSADEKTRQASPEHRSSEPATPTVKSASQPATPETTVKKKENKKKEKIKEQHKKAVIGNKFSALLFADHE